MFVQYFQHASSTRRPKTAGVFVRRNVPAPEPRLEPGDQGMVLYKMRSNFRSCQRKRCARGIRPTRVRSSFGRKNYDGSRNQNHASLEEKLKGPQPETAVANTSRDRR